ncbi:hypothetical protein ACFFTK_10200 [Pseudonocardia petroleophila]|uniref:Uncharacterized protein n=1 Tax=Pseudonocardia petroleophila TaxID=37331 RepID=A0A7G7MLH6_9PSEU|nr:hypothetical protein [Pseudonocardia petroleophila]QNG53637.1 hypothetical protein H6H00_06705 [Pseudonocardia petroleophila]
MSELLAVLGPMILVSLGAFIGRLSISQQQRIVRLRQERHRWLLHDWQHELERSEGLCARCRGR